MVLWPFIAVDMHREPESAMIYRHKTSARDAILESPITGELQANFCSHQKSV
jgi:hypothetical protein